MLDIIVVGIAVASIGAGIATGLHYLFAPQFARRYAGAFNLAGIKDEIKQALTNDVPHLIAEYAPKALPLVQTALSNAVYDGVMKAQGEVRQDAVSQEMSERGKAGAEARQMKKMEKDAAKAMILQQIEQKYPGASAILPQIKSMIGFDPLEYAVKNPGAAMALLDKFLGGGGGSPVKGGGSEWITR